MTKKFGAEALRPRKRGFSPQKSVIYVPNQQKFEHKSILQYKSKHSHSIDLNFFITKAYFYLGIFNSKVE